MSEPLSLHGVEIVDTFAEAFPIKATRLIVTACTDHWAEIAAREFCGNATSVIACDIEAAVEKVLPPEDIPDRRPGRSILAFAFDRNGLESAMQSRVGQCILTCPSTACFDGLPEGDSGKRIRVGSALRYFGDGFQISKKLAGRHFWRVPVMDGEFLCEATFGTVTGVAGGNLIFCGEDQQQTLAAAEAASKAAAECPDVALPFPGGIVRSGSKVGSKYKALRASTNDRYCPTLRGATAVDLPEDANCVYEIVIDGLSSEAVAASMKAGLHAAAQCPGLLQITAGNYGGKLGPYHFHLRELL